MIAEILNGALMYILVGVGAGFLFLMVEWKVLLKH